MLINFEHKEDEQLISIIIIIKNLKKQLHKMAQNPNILPHRPILHRLAPQYLSIFPILINLINTITRITLKYNNIQTQLQKSINDRIK